MKYFYRVFLILPFVLVVNTIDAVLLSLFTHDIQLGQIKGVIKFGNKLIELGRYEK